MTGSRSERNFNDEKTEMAVSLYLNSSVTSWIDVLHNLQPKGMPRAVYI